MNTQVPQLMAPEKPLSAMTPEEHEAFRQNLKTTAAAQVRQHSLMNPIVLRPDTEPPELPKTKEELEKEKANKLQEYEIVSIGDFLQQTIKEPKQLIKNLLYQGDEMCVGSGSKSYKTFTLLDLGLSIASGSHWLGMDTTQGKVLFVNFELKPFTIQKRIKAILEARNLLNNTITFD